MRADCSSITCRSWCCTAAVEPSPNSRCSSLARCPFSSPKTSSTLRAEELGDDPRLVGERGLDLARDLLELVADELGVRRAACSRSSTRAPTSIASVTTAHRVRRPPRSGGRGTRPSPDRRRRRSRRSRGPSGRGRGDGGGVVAASMSSLHATRRSRRNPLAEVRVRHHGHGRRVRRRRAFPAASTATTVQRAGAVGGVDERAAQSRPPALNSAPLRNISYSTASTAALPPAQAHAAAEVGQIGRRCSPARRVGGGGHPCPPAPRSPAAVRPETFPPLSRGPHRERVAPGRSSAGRAWTNRLAVCTTAPSISTSYQNAQRSVEAPHASDTLDAIVAVTRTVPGTRRRRHVRGGGRRQRRTHRRAVARPRPARRRGRSACQLGTSPRDRLLGAVARVIDAVDVRTRGSAGVVGRRVPAQRHRVLGHGDHAAGAGRRRWAGSGRAAANADAGQAQQRDQRREQQLHRDSLLVVRPGCTHREWRRFFSGVEKPRQTLGRLARSRPRDDDRRRCPGPPRTNATIALDRVRRHRRRRPRPSRRAGCGATRPRRAARPPGASIRGRRHPARARGHHTAAFAPCRYGRQMRDLEGELDACGGAARPRRDRAAARGAGRDPHATAAAELAKPRSGARAPGRGRDRPAAAAGRHARAPPRSAPTPAAARARVAARRRRRRRARRARRARPARHARRSAVARRRARRLPRRSAPDAPTGARELVPLAFEDHAAGIDRLRAARPRVPARA